MNMTTNPEEMDPKTLQESKLRFPKIQDPTIFQKRVSITEMNPKTTYKY